MQVSALAHGHYFETDLVINDFSREQSYDFLKQKVNSAISRNLPWIVIEGNRTKFSTLEFIFQSHLLKNPYNRLGKFVGKSRPFHIVQMVWIYLQIRVSNLTFWVSNLTF